MEELLKIAREFLEANPSINEIEISDYYNYKVRLVRFTLSPGITYNYLSQTESTGEL